MFSYAKIILPAILLVAFAAVNAQKQTIQVTVKDSATNQPLTNATVVIISNRDSVLLDFGITDSLGKYIFKNVNMLRAAEAVASVSGFMDKRVSLAGLASNDKSKADIQLELLLAADFNELENVMISGKASPIKMNKDTLEFNADFFKTHTNAVLEDLLRKLPGVEVRQGKEIYFNGQRVGKILVDGKEFFSSDPVVVLKNLPTEIIQKIQFSDEKNTVAKETRQQKDIPKTLNIRLKKEIKGGMFGKVFAGYGTDNRYEAGGILNTFRDTLQVSFIGSTNNQGRTGFSMQDLNDLGGFGRSQGMGGVQNAGSIAYGNSRGIEKKDLLGTNVNYNIGKKIQLNGQYFYNGGSRRSQDQSNTEQFIADSSLLYNSVNSGNNTDRGHKASIGFRWKQDSTGYLNIQTNASFTSAADESSAQGSTYSKTVPLLSNSITNMSSRNSGNNFSASADYTKSFVKHKLDWSVSVNYSNAANNSLSRSNNLYNRLLNNFIPDSLRQVRENNTPQRQLTIRNNFNKTWKDRHTVSYAIDYTNSRDAQGGDTYQYSKITSEDELMPGLSVKLMQGKNNFNQLLSYRYGYKGITVQAGVALRNLFITNRYNYDSIPVLNRQFNLLSPTLSVNFKDINLSYSKSLEEPNSYYLRPVTDSSNPMYTFSGNPNLKPTINNSYGLQYNKYFTKSQISIYANASMIRQTDAIASANQVFSDGKTVSSFVNINRATNYNGNVSISKSYYKNNWNYSTNLYSYFYINTSPVLLNRQVFNTTTTNINLSVDGYIGYKDIFRWQPRYSISINQSKSQDSAVRRANTTQHTLSNSLHVQIAHKLAWDANLNYNINPGISEGYKKQWLFCDMAITCSFLKKDKAQIKLSGFDIFNQNQGIYRFASQNYIGDYKSLVQKQYFMLTLLYSIKKL